ncbi:MAG TPA: hypothetical protein PLP93_08230 [Nitrosomonas sp.]|nr:hypothetical protein [Nitrosomonas sp.]HRB46160.1 hypothetical protein [Nitrosomonas sp.]
MGWASLCIRGSAVWLSHKQQQWTDNQEPQTRWPKQKSGSQKLNVERQQMLRPGNIAVALFGTPNGLRVGASKSKLGNRQIANRKPPDAHKEATQKNHEILKAPKESTAKAGAEGAKLIDLL